MRLVASDACVTIPDFVTSAPHFPLSLIYFDFDLYQPTKVPLETLWPRVVKGGVVACDALILKD